MPFTLAHPVAAIPLHNKLGKYGALSALIIGSITPDIAYITPFLVHQRLESHSLIGLYLYCIPMGLTLYFVYHKLMAPVLISLCSTSLVKRIHSDYQIGKLPGISTPTLLISLILGAATHIIWDFFTHESGIPQYIHLLMQPVAVIDNYPLMSFRILQHASSLLGTMLLLYWVWRWYQRTTEYHQVIWQAPNWLRKLSLLSLLVLPSATAILYGWQYLPETDVLYGLYALQVFIRHGITAFLASFLVVTLVLGVLYQGLLIQHNHPH